MAQPAILVLLNDFHVGHPYALSPARWTLHDGNLFSANAMQRVLRKHLLTCAERVKALRQDARLIVAYVGDAIEGLHHNTTQVITPRLDTQEAMAISVLREFMNAVAFNEWCFEDTIEFISGTDAHDGPGVASLERIARQVKNITCDGRCTRDRWLLNINGVRFDIAHHPEAGTGTREHTKGNVWQSWLKSYYTRQRDLNEAWPRYVIRAHRHEYIERAVYDTLSREVMRGWLLAPWKATDEFVVKRNVSAIAYVGMLAFVIDASGCCQQHDWRIKLAHARDKYEEL